MVLVPSHEQEKHQVGPISIYVSWSAKFFHYTEVFIVLSSLWEVGVDITEAVLKGTEVDSIAGVSSNSI